MKKLLNKRIAYYTLKTGLLLTGISILVTPVITAAMCAAMDISDKISVLRQKNKKKPEEDAWFTETKEEEP